MSYLRKSKLDVQPNITKSSVISFYVNWRIRRTKLKFEVLLKSDPVITSWDIWRKEHNLNMLLQLAKIPLVGKTLTTAVE